MTVVKSILVLKKQEKNPVFKKILWRFGEELKEFTWALGAEYTYQDSFMVRTGYFNESEEKGSRKYFTLGAGFKFKSAQIDLSYLFSTSQVRNPLENTLRFSLTFNLGEEFYNDW